MAKRLFTGFVLALLIASPALAQETESKFKDKIRYIDDEGVVRNLEGVRVETATYKEVVYDTKGGRRAAPKNGAKVLRISYGDEPGVYTSGVKNLHDGRFQAATSDFDGAKNAVDAGKAREWLTEYASVRKGQALLGEARKNPGKAEEAILAFRDALKANPESLLFADIQLGMAEAFSLDKRWDDAKNAAQALENVGKEIKHPVWQALGLKSRADVSLAENDYSRAGNIYQDLVLLARREHQYADSDLRKQELKDMEILGAVQQGWALVAFAEETEKDADWNKAKSHFQSLATQFPGDEVVAAAVLNGVGRALMDKSPREALMKFVQAEVLHFSARNEVARALWLKAKALNKIPGDENREAAETALKELKKFYPDSEWAQKVETK